ncbi:MAG TPA: TIGR03643 family protein [Flavobacterium sp.]|jgi:uncharacterized protein (TIGR03643 family)
MRKNINVALDYEQVERLVSMALEERKPFEVIKEEFGVPEKDVIEIMRKKLTKPKFELWRQKASASKPKPKPMVTDDFDELDGKYYIKNKLI